MNSIYYLRNCLPESELIRNYVTFHIYFPLQLYPSNMAKTEEEISQWSYNCKVPKPPYINVDLKTMFQIRKNFTYPINTGRNIARKSANTYFILDSDIDLYPNYGLAPKFLEMVERNPKAILNGKTVFTIPIYEIKNHATIPNNKEELNKMLQKHTAVLYQSSFFPQQKEWLRSNDTDVLKIFNRHNYSHRLPVYISDNNEPLYDERFSREGMLDRRIQNYVMCLKDYNYSLLHPAFLIHAPDIKTQDKNSKGFEITDATFKQILSDYKSLYGIHNHCEF